ncbi:Transducin (beta)-like 1 X-linked receptor 1 [Mortierella sp. NVP85]|nr:Transducin (beta)-like 1 X-linked receptor 1 [Mortierella sp. NVP85]
MADTKVEGLDSETLYEPLSLYLEALKRNAEPYLLFQAAYAFQALLCVEDRETLWQATIQRTGKAVQGMSGLLSVVEESDLDRFIDGLKSIQQGMAGASEVVQPNYAAFDGVTSLTVSGQNFLDGLKEGFSFKRKCAWYPALRGADAFIRDGEFCSFKKLVCEAPCRLDPAFQWGVCQRLGEIASNLMWNARTRRSAVAFLAEIYRDDEDWSHWASIKEWILIILMKLSSSEGGVQQYARRLLQELESKADAREQGYFQTCREKDLGDFPLKIASPPLSYPCLLDRIRNKSNVEGTLRQFRKQRMRYQGNAVYIQLQAKASLNVSDDQQFLLIEKVKEFLDSDKKVFLLLGDSGAGKSTFGRELECNLWEKYENTTGRIPLHVNLPAIDNPELDLIAKQLRKAEFSETEIRELKIHRKFILICDGYDESLETHNLYMSNRLNQPGEWNAQMVVSCRTGYLGADYRDNFYPGDLNRSPEPSQFQEAVLTPLTLGQIQDYVSQYVSIYQPLWQFKDYERAIDLIPGLKELLSNPFLMRLALDILPRIVDSNEHLQATQVTRVTLYGQFMEQWLERGLKRISEEDLNPQAKAALENLVDEGFIQCGTDYLKRLSVAIYREQDGQPVVRYAHFKDDGTWKTEFFGREDEKQLLREAAPLTRSGNQHRFIHRSIMEYGLVLAIFDPRDSENIRLEVESQGEDNKNEQEYPGSPLFWRSFVEDPSILQFLGERTQQEPLFKQQLLHFIELSKTDKKWSTAAANAITILVRAGVQFNGTDLQGIRIPGADLSYGVFDSAQLEGADLENVNLSGVWFRQADLTKARMTGVWFNDLPTLFHDSMVLSCAYSPDGTSLAVGLEDGDINVYSTSSWEKVQTLDGHDKPVWHVVYSPQGNLVATASSDTTVRVWDVESKSCRLVLTSHTDGVKCVTFSPQGDQVASASDDKTVRLWDITTGVCCQTLPIHSSDVTGVAYSPQGNLLVSGGSEFTVTLWDIQTGESIQTLKGHSNNVTSVAFSPRGDNVASSSQDGTIRIWDVEKGICRRVLTGHSTNVCRVVYSPKCDQVVSGSEDGTVRIWDTRTGACNNIFIGCSSASLSIAYSPEGDRVAFGSGDKTIRLLDVSIAASRLISSRRIDGTLCIKYSPEGNEIVSRSSDSTIRLFGMETKALHQEFRGHSDTVTSAAYSPQGDHVVSASYDKTVRLWDTQSGECQRIFIGHSDGVNCVAYSPQGDQIASASNDKTVRLWDLETGDCPTTLSGHSERILCVVYSPRGDRIASCSADNTVRLWSIVTGVCNQILEGHSDQVCNVVYSPQGNELASASGDTTVRLWNVETGEWHKALTGHISKVTSVKYSPESDMVASGSLDGTVRLWSVESGLCLAIVQNFQDNIFDIAWSETYEGTYLVTCCQDGSLHIWQTLREEEGQCRVCLRWGFMNGFPLTLMKATIQDVHGLSELQQRLLEQHGAEGIPAPPTR